GLEPLLSVLGLGQAVYGAFALEGLTLLALGRVWAWSALQGGYTLLSLLLVGGGSAWGGVEGYAWGHLASLSVFLLPQRVLRRALGKVGMGERVGLLASLAPLFFPWALGPWTLGALPVGLALMARQLGKARRTLQDLWRKGA
ncbi:hypothetical protein, partial [Thermus sp.]|uniref:hypothetical protein n=1 Tax=Thermus sp. TaxID=275 RepID=UPI0026060B2E